MDFIGHQLAYSEHRNGRNMRSSDVARAFPGGRVAHPEGQNEEENKKSLRKKRKIDQNLRKKLRKVELLPTLMLVRLATALMRSTFARLRILSEMLNLNKDLYVVIHIRLI